MNKILVVTFIITLITVTGSIFLILNKLNVGEHLLTGKAVFQTGVVNITVLKTAGITLTVTNNSFGQGELNGDGTATVVNNTMGITNPSTFLTPIPFSIRVDGNTPVNITYNGTPAADFIGGTSPVFRVNVTNGEAGSCNGISNTSHFIGGAINDDVTAAYKTLCNNTDFTDTRDTINVTVFLELPSDTTAAAKNATLQFKAVINGSTQAP